MLVGIAENKANIINEEQNLIQNKIKSAWNEGRVAINVFLSTPSSFSAEVMASLDWDGVTIDMQHGVIDYGSLIPMLQGISRYEPSPMVRVPWNDPAIIMKSLDAGAYGVICPMINNKKECENFVKACRYAPYGYRSTGPIRAVFYAGSDYHYHADTTILTFAMIETQEAIENLDEICSVNGLDAIYIGPSDLSVSLGGGPGGDQREKTVVKRIEEALSSAHRHGIKAGIHTMSAEYAIEMIEKGFDLVTLSSDFRHMIANASDMLAAVKIQKDR